MIQMTSEIWYIANSPDLVIVAKSYDTITSAWVNTLEYIRSNNVPRSWPTIAGVLWSILVVLVGVGTDTSRMHANDSASCFGGPD